MSPLTNMANTRDWVQSSQELHISAYLEPMTLILVRPGADLFDLDVALRMAEGYREMAAETLSSAEFFIHAQSEVVRGAD